jgi:hypothetical protein
VDCIEKIKFYADAPKREQLMLNIGSETLPQRNARGSMPLFAQEAMPALRSL